ncbi:MAG: helix-turn-helix domain-containing protein [Acidimicrobiales bacterium]
MADYSVKEAAAALGVSVQHVRRLIRSGLLPARLIGDVWVLPADAVRERSSIAPPAGRPLSAETAWRLLQLVDVTLVRSAVLTGEVPTALDELAGSRHQRRRLLDHLAHAPDVGQWHLWLRRRADRKLWWVHPAAIAKLDADERVQHIHPPAVVWPDGDSRYVSAADEEHLAATFAAKPASDGNVALLVFDPDVAPGRIPAAAAVVDLLNSPEARQRYAAGEALGGAHRRLLAEFKRP